MNTDFISNEQFEKIKERALAQVRRHQDKSVDVTFDRVKYKKDNVRNGVYAKQQSQWRSYRTPTKEQVGSATRIALNTLLKKLIEKGFTHVDLDFPGVHVNKHLDGDGITIEIELFAEKKAVEIIT